MKAARRRFLIDAGSAAAAWWLAPPAVAATIDERVPLVRQLSGDAPLRQGRIKLELPRIAENGHSVAAGVVDLAPGEAPRIEDLFLLSEKNPRPQIVHFHFGPRAGPATVSTRIRLAGSQRIVALARCADDSWWYDQAEVSVAEGACYEGE